MPAFSPAFLRARWFVMAMRMALPSLLLVVTVLSLIPNPDDVPGGPAFSRFVSALIFGSEAQADKVSHFIAWGVIGGAGVLAAVRPFGRVLWLGVGLIVYSGIIEVLQRASGLREGDWADLVVNIAAVLVGMAAALLLLRLAPRGDVRGASPG